MLLSVFVFAVASAGLNCVLLAVRCCLFLLWLWTDLTKYMLCCVRDVSWDCLRVVCDVA